jgi:PAS domain S-box-containing protein
MPKRKILVVEDEAIIAMELKETLEHLGYSVLRTVFRGEDAVILAEKTHPDIVLMDIHLKGDVDGITAAEEISTRFNIPVIFITAHSDKETLARAIRSRPYGYLIKPFNERDLYSNIEMAIHKHRVRSKLEDDAHDLVDSALNIIPEAVVIADPRGRIIRMNLEAERLTGYTLKEVKGTQVFTALGVTIPGRDTLMEKLLVSSEHAGSMISFPSMINIRTKQGERLPMMLSTGLIREEGSTRIMEIAFVIESPPHATVPIRGGAASGGSTDALIRAMRPPFVSVTGDLSITSFNDAFARLCRYFGRDAPEEGIGLHRALPEFFIGDAGIIEEIINDARSFATEKAVKTTTGAAVFALEYMPYSSTNGVMDSVGIQIRNISDEKLAVHRYEKILRDFRTSEKIIGEVGDLCASLKATVARMAQVTEEEGGISQDMKREFAASKNTLEEIDIRLIELEGYRKR